MGRDQETDTVLIDGQYLKALEYAKAVHANSKNFGGMFLRPRALDIKAIIDRLEIRTILDYGCGKGLQYEWRNPGVPDAIPIGTTIEEFWGIEVTKYDPAYPPFAAEPVGTFDLVICTHVLGSIPISCLGLIIKRLYSLSNKALYVAERIGQPRKKWAGPDVALPQDMTPDDWKVLLIAHHRKGIETHFFTKTRTPAGKVTKSEIIGR